MDWTFLCLYLNRVDLSWLTMGSKVAVLSSSFSSFGSSALVLSSTTTGATASAAGVSIGVSSVDMFVGNVFIVSILFWVVLWSYDTIAVMETRSLLVGRRSLRCVACFACLLLESFLDHQQQGYFDFRWWLLPHRGEKCDWFSPLLIHFNNCCLTINGVLILQTNILNIVCNSRPRLKHRTCLISTIFDFNQICDVFHRYDLCMLWALSTKQQQLLIVLGAGCLLWEAEGILASN